MTRELISGVSRADSTCNSGTNTDTSAEPAVYHDDIRGNLIQEMQAMGTYSRSPLDITQEDSVLT